MSDIVNIIVNNGVAVGVVCFFLYKDYKWNDELIKTLTTIQVTLEEISKGLTNVQEHRTSDNFNKEV